MPMLCAELSPRATVLVVEDEPLLRDSTSQQLAALGYRVLAAADGPHALELLIQIARL
jgi:CheY-like chemotaxis protein